MKVEFDELFERAFESGLSDIKFFVKRGAVTADALVQEAVLFEEAISGGKTKQVEHID